MAYTFNAEGYRNLIRRKAQERFPNAKDPISDLADAVYEQTCETPSIKDKVDFRCRVHKWLSPEVKTLPRIPEQVIAMADILNVRIDDLYHGQEGQSPADVISYYSVAVNDDVSRYDTLKSQCGNFPDGYDEFDKQFIDYIVEYKAVHVMDKAVKEKDYDTTHMLMDVNNSSIYVGRMLPLFQREFLPELFDAFYDPRNRWILQGDTSEGNGFIPCRIKLAKEDVVALLDQPAFIAKVASEHQQKKAGEWTYSVTFVHGWFDNPDLEKTPYLHGAFKLTFDLAVETEQLRAIMPFLTVGTKHNNLVASILGNEKLRFEKDLVYFGEQYREPVPMTNIALAQDMDHLRAIAKAHPEQADIFNAYFDSVNKLMALAVPTTAQ